MSTAQALIYFGDGNRALFYEEKNPELNRHNIKVIPMLVVPTKEIIRKYSLTEEDLNIETDDNRRGMWIEFPVHEVDWLNRSKDGAVLLIWCAFDGAPTLIMNKLDTLLDVIKVKDKEAARHLAQISTLQRHLEDITVNLPEFHRNQKALTDIHAGTKEDKEDD